MSVITNNALPIPVAVDVDEDPTLGQPKLIYSGDEWTGQPYENIREDGISLVADLTDAIHVTPDYGIQLSGRLSLSAMPDQVLFGGGYFAINPLVLTCLPSTTPTPVSWLVKTTPPILDGFGCLGDALDVMS